MGFLGTGVVVGQLCGTKACGIRLAHGSGSLFIPIFRERERMVQWLRKYMTVEYSNP